MESDCLACKLPIKSLHFIKCQGFCKGSFHHTCASLSKAQLTFIDDNPNFLWFCNDCAASMKSPEIRSVFTALADAVSSLKTALEDVKKELKVNCEQVAELSANLSVATAAPPTTPVWPDRNKRGAKRRLQQTETPKTEMPRIAQGKKVLANSSVPILAKAPPKDLFWIWLSSFPPSVTEADIAGLVKDCLSCEDENSIDVKALVKKGTDVSTLTSISFKVGVGKEFRVAALDADTWPTGLSFREFVDFGPKEKDKSASGFGKTPRLESPKTH